MIISDDELEEKVADLITEILERVEEGQYSRTQLFELKNKFEEISEEY